MPRKKHGLPEISDDEEAIIQAGIAADRDNPEWTEADFAAARPASEALPPELYAALTRPRASSKTGHSKLPVTLSLDRATVEAFIATGAGWQTRMNDALALEAERLAGRPQTSR